MMSSILAIAATAILSSLLTIGFAYLLYVHRVKKRLERELDRMADKYGEMIRERVRQGILDGVSSIPSSDVLRGTQRTVTNTAADLLRTGLSALVGDDKPKS